MGRLDVVRMYGRFLAGLPRFCRRRISLEESRAAIRKGIEEREESFLRLMRRGVYGYPPSPYLPLLRWARCELGDLESSVRSKGLEPTLHALREAGVYFTFEEYKGRKPVIRGGQALPIQPSDFDNPYTAGAYQAETSGTTGAGTRVNMDLENLAATVPHLMVLREIHGLLDSPMALWRGILPDPTGLGIILRAAPYEGVPVRWFTPITRADFAPALRNRVATQYILAVSRLLGVRVPRPEPVPIEQAGVIARWAAGAVRRHGSCLVSTSVSLSVRVCLAARDEGIDLSGAAFLGGGEPLTPAKHAAVVRTGARFVPVYITGDMGPTGLGCSRPFEENDLHLLDDCIALIQHPRTVPHSGATVEAFHFTSLRTSTSKVLLNVESDDYGIVERRSCGCPFEELGYGTHVRRIRSFSKLTGEGVTLVGSDMTRILEEVLPARFGGGPLDYQLLEEEDGRGLTRLTLLVSPRIPIERDELVVEAVLEALGRDNDDRSVVRAYWRQTGTLRVRRVEPEWTARGKLTSIRVAGRERTARSDKGALR